MRKQVYSFRLELSESRDFSTGVPVWRGQCQQWSSGWGRDQEAHSGALPGALCTGAQSPDMRVSGPGLGACAEAVRTEQRQRLRLGLTRDDTAPHLLCTVCVISHIWCSEEERSTAKA